MFDGGGSRVRGPSKKRELKRHDAIFDAFLQFSKNLKARRRWIVDFVVIDGINKIIELKDDKTVTLREFLRILKSTSLGIGPQVVEESTNKSGIFILTTKRANPLEKDKKSNAKKYSFLWCGNKNEIPFVDRLYNWKENINERSFQTLTKTSLNCSKENKLQEKPISSFNITSVETMDIVNP